jgi:hypothetical protein
MGMLEPVPLTSLAEAMRDEAWLDMRIVEHGNVPRVRVQSILIMTHNETVELYQELPEDAYRYLEVDSEDIMAALPSCFERDDVPEPNEPPPSGADPEEYTQGRPFASYKLPSEARAMFPLVRRAVFNQFANPDHMERDFWDLTNVSSRNPTNLYHFTLHVRYALLLTLYEVTELSQADVCYVVGYHSIQPFISARQLAKREKDGKAKDTRLIDLTRAAVKSVTKFVGRDRLVPRQDTIL